MATITYTGKARVEELSQGSPFNVIAFYDVGTVKFSVPTTLGVDVMVLGGGGGGGGNIQGGGGGAGSALLGLNINVINGDIFTITSIGQGGAGGSNLGAIDGAGLNGGDTSILINGVTYTAKGGGGGGGTSYGSSAMINGKSGGCGGGGSGGSSGSSSGGLSVKNTYPNWTSYGNPGGNNFGSGGGIGGPGNTKPSSQIPGAVSGLGFNFNGLFGSNFGVDGYFGGGGCSGSDGRDTINALTRGLHGGGAGGTTSYSVIGTTLSNGGDAINYTGGGGGGALSFRTTRISRGGKGGSGIILIKGAFKAILNIPSPGNPIKFSYLKSIFGDTNTECKFSRYYNNGSLLNNSFEKITGGNITVPSTIGTPIKLIHFHDIGKIILKSGNSTLTEASSKTLFNITPKILQSYPISTTYVYDGFIYDYLLRSIGLFSTTGAYYTLPISFPFYWYGKKYYCDSNLNNQIYWITDSVISFGKIFNYSFTWTSNDNALFIGFNNSTNWNDYTYASFTNVNTSFRYAFEFNVSSNIYISKNHQIATFTVTTGDTDNPTQLDANKTKKNISFIRGTNYQYIQIVLFQTTSTTQMWKATAQNTTIDIFNTGNTYNRPITGGQSLVLRSDLYGNNWTCFNQSYLDLQNII